MDDLIMTQRISKLKEKIHSNVRYASIEQAKLLQTHIVRMKINRK